AGNPVSRADAAPRKIAPGERRQPITEIQEFVIVLNRQHSFRHTELRQFQEVRLPTQRIERHPAIAEEAHPLVREPSDAAQLMHVSKKLIEHTVVARVAKKFSRPTGIRGPAPRAAGSPPPRKKTPPPPRTPPRLSERVLVKVHRPKIAHLQQIPHLNVFR